MGEPQSPGWGGGTWETAAGEGVGYAIVCRILEFKPGACKAAFLGDLREIFRILE